jgi:hypothetical protein
MKDFNKDYKECVSVIASCQTLSQLEVAGKMVSNYCKMYPNVIHGLGIPFMSKKMIILSK